MPARLLQRLFVEREIGNPAEVENSPPRVGVSSSLSMASNRRIAASFEKMSPERRPFYGPARPATCPASIAVEQRQSVAP